MNEEVYILIHHIHYETSNIIGVYADKNVAFGALLDRVKEYTNEYQKWTLEPSRLEARTSGKSLYVQTEEVK